MAIRLNPDTPGPYNTLAQIRQSQGNREEAARLFAKGAAVKRKLEETQARMLGTMAPASREAPRPKR
jgi:hypothetical protein